MEPISAIQNKVPKRGPQRPLGARDTHSFLRFLMYAFARAANILASLFTITPGRELARAELSRFRLRFFVRLLQNTMQKRIYLLGNAKLERFEFGP